ncbi:hypothetical protein K458DRAFT_302792, partial [Lentithecium fluviatile CBS 122367]
TVVPSELAQWIQPPEGMPSAVPTGMFVGQLGFRRGLNYKFVAENDGGNQIFLYLRMAIADALQLKEDDVINYGLTSADTWNTLGWGQTLAVFMIPGPLNDTLGQYVRTPASVFYHNKNDTVNTLTSLVDPATYQEYSPYKVGNPDNVNDPGATATNGPAQGGALGGDMAASRPINGTSAGIATGAVIGAIAYGAAMFFVARRYRKKKMSHQRTSSVPSSSRYTYGSVGGLGANNWMSGARYGRLTPGLPGSRGSSSSNGRSVRTQQISAPVMAENSLGWN